MLYFLEDGFWSDPVLVLLFLTSLLIIVFLRYVLFAWAYRYILRRIRKNSLTVSAQGTQQIRMELRYAFTSSCVFTAIATASLFAWHMGWTKIYADIDDYPVGYLFVSGFMFMLLYETYYYWLHRWLHKPRIFRAVHKVHHQSINPTVFTSFSFHPIEALLQFIFFPLAIIAMPMHYTVLFVVLILFTVSALINHGGEEVYRPKWLRSHIIGASHHDVHHKSFNHNFGLLFTWWDRWLKTEHPDSGAS